MPRNLLVYDRWTHECRDRQGRRRVCRRGLAPKNMASQSFIDGEPGNRPQIMGYGGVTRDKVLGHILQVVHKACGQLHLG